MNNEKKQIGRIKIYDHQKGYGFIEREKGKDIFVNYQQIPAQDVNVLVGSMVEFDVDDDPRGPRAVNVRLLT